LAQNVAGSVRRQLADKLLEGGGAVSPGPLAACLTVRIREVEAGVAEGFLGGSRAALTLAPLAASLYIVNSTLFWGAVIVVAPFAMLTSLARKAWKRSHARALALAEGLHQELDELVVHMDVWRTYGAGERVSRTLDTLGARVGVAAGRAEGARAALSGANEVLAAAALLICVAVARWLSWPLADGSLVAFAAIFFMSYRPLRDLSDARSALERGAHALGELERLARPTRRVSPVVARATRTWNARVLLVEGVGVRRQTAGPVTSFVARPGEIVAIVGPTGSGKTTLLRALLGLEPSAAGVIRYGGDDLTRNGVGPFERPFAWVPQEASVISGTLEDNISLGRNDARACEVLASLGAQGLARDLQASVLGSAGRPVSGGERKWIALARAIATGLPVLLLDEPTAGLDAAARRDVLAALARLRGTRTIVLVSHEQQPIAIADQVIVVGTTSSRTRADRNSLQN